MTTAILASVERVSTPISVAVDLFLSLKYAPPMLTLWERTGEDGIRRRGDYQIRPLEHLCAECGYWFAPRRTDQRYCSNACRMRAHYKGKRSSK